MKTTVTDPICGMEVDPNNAAATAEHDGGTFYFCSEHCRQKFVNETPAVPADGHVENGQSCCHGGHHPEAETAAGERKPAKKYFCPRHSNRRGCALSGVGLAPEPGYRRRSHEPELRVSHRKRAPFAPSISLASFLSNDFP